MNKLMIGLFILTLSAVTAIGAVKSYLDHWQYMKVADAEKRWGSKKFSVETFAKGNLQERASQAADLVRKQSLVGKSADDVVKLMGPTSVSEVRIHKNCCYAKMPFDL